MDTVAQIGQLLETVRWTNPQEGDLMHVFLEFFFRKGQQPKNALAVNV